MRIVRSLAAGLVAGIALVSVTAVARAQQGAIGAGVAADSAAAMRTIALLHGRMEAGDSAGVLALLTEDLAVLESGGYEDRAEFRRHHLPADIEFARAVRQERRVRAFRLVGDVAWVSSTSSAQGEFRGRAINSLGAELMVLRRDAASPTGWKVAAIHWSSRVRRS